MTLKSQGAAKPAFLNLTPEINVIERGNWLLQVDLWPPHADVAWAHPSTSAPPNNKYNEPLKYIKEVMIEIIVFKGLWKISDLNSS